MTSSPFACHLRPALPDDLAFQALVYASTRQEEMDAAQFPAEMREPFLAMQFKAQTTHYIQCNPGAEWSIIECDGEGAGRLILDRTEERFNIMDIALLPAFRGRGIGTAVMQQVLDEATAKQVPVHLCAFTGERAIQLYQRLGFQPLSDDGIRTELEWRPVAVG